MRKKRTSAARATHITRASLLTRICTYCASPSLSPCPCDSTLADRCGSAVVAMAQPKNATAHSSPPNNATAHCSPPNNATAHTAPPAPPGYSAESWPTTLYLDISKANAADRTLITRYVFTTVQPIVYEDPSAFVELLQQKCALEAMYGTISAETFFVTVAGDTHVDVDRGVDLDLRCPEAYQHAWSISGISGTGAISAIGSAHSFAHVRAMEAFRK